MQNKLRRVLSNSVLVCITISSILVSCKKSSKPAADPDPVIPPDNTIKVVPVDDPAMAGTIGFFGDEWQPRQFAAPSYTDAAVPTSAANTITIDASSVITKIPNTIFGHNAVWWMGPVAPQAAADIKNLNANILRFPGGNSSNNYFWNADQGKLPDDVPSIYIDADGVEKPASYNYGKSDHNWEFNLQNYYDLLQQTNTQGLISVNYAYARYSTSSTPVANAAHLAAEWVRYDNGRTKYWEIGNEHYGNWQAGYRIDVSKNKDGQPEIINGRLYATHAKVFIDSMHKAAADIGKTIFIGVTLYESPATESWQTNTTKTWNSGVLGNINNKADYYVVHNYFTSSGNENATAILNAASTVPAQMMTFMKSQFQNYNATEKPIAFDEWNMFAAGSKQQVSNISGVFGIMVQAESIKNKFGLAARWDLVNGWDNGNDHGLFSSGDEPGIAKWNPRPSYYYLYYFRKMLGDRMVPTTVEGNAALKSYASTYSSGEANLTVINTSTTVQSVQVKFRNFIPGNRYYWYNLEGGNDNGEFSRKVVVNGNSNSLDAGGPADYLNLKARSTVVSNGVRITVPARGAVIMVISKK